MKQNLIWTDRINLNKYLETPIEETQSFEKVF